MRIGHLWLIRDLMRTSEAFWSSKEFGIGCRHTQLIWCWFPLSCRNVIDALMSMHPCNATSRGYTMGKARPAVIARALASSATLFVCFVCLATPPAGWTRILHRLVKLVILEATFTAPEHGHARPEQKHTLAKASYAGLFRQWRATQLSGRLPSCSVRHHVPPFWCFVTLKGPRCLVEFEFHFWQTNKTRKNFLIGT